MRSGAGRPVAPALAALLAGCGSPEWRAGVGLSGVLPNAEQLSDAFQADVAGALRAGKLDLEVSIARRTYSYDDGSGDEGGIEMTPITLSVRYIFGGRSPCGFAGLGLVAAAAASESVPGVTEMGDVSDSFKLLGGVWFDLGEKAVLLAELGYEASADDPALEPAKGPLDLDGFVLRGALSYAF
jgi:hypothetical protein